MKIFLTCLLAITCASAAGHISAQSYPTRVIKILNAFPAGGADDTLSRIIAPRLEAALGRPVVVENRPGAAGNIGAELAAKSEPDGYTLFMGTSGPLASSVSLYSNLRYNVTKDFAPITRVGFLAYVLASHPSFPVSSIKELVTLAKAKPGELNYASAGTGSGSHLVAELFKNRAAVDIVHIPYKGGTSLLTAVIAGETHFGSFTILSAVPQIKAGRMRALAVTGPARSPVLPDVPTMAESGYPRAEVTATFGLLAPAGTPDHIIVTLNSAVRKILENEEVQERFATLGVVAKGSTPEEFGSILAGEIAKWTDIIKAANIRVE